MRQAGDDRSMASFVKDFYPQISQMTQIEDKDEKLVVRQRGIHRGDARFCSRALRSDDRSTTD
ncbi:hypothetical protein T5B8_04698 [Salinisphaera sp. T5B8]